MFAVGSRLSSVVEQRSVALELTRALRSGCPRRGTRGSRPRARSLGAARRGSRPAPRRSPRPTDLLRRGCRPWLRARATGAGATPRSRSAPSPRTSRAGDPPTTTRRPRPWPRARGTGRWARAGGARIVSTRGCRRRRPTRGSGRGRRRRPRRGHRREVASAPIAGSRTRAARWSRATTCPAIMSRVTDRSLRARSASSRWDPLGSAGAVSPAAELEAAENRQREILVRLVNERDVELVAHSAGS